MSVVVALASRVVFPAVVVTIVVVLIVVLIAANAAVLVEKDYIATLTAEEIEEECELGLERAVAGAALFSTLDELKAGWV
jgi:hypothetical protein